jgi:hypothetical protein
VVNNFRNLQEENQRIAIDDGVCPIYDSSWGMPPTLLYHRPNNVYFASFIVERPLRIVKCGTRRKVGQVG